eukprot:788764-Rhodomonas_salina.7
MVRKRLESKDSSLVLVETCEVPFHGCKALRKQRLQRVVLRLSDKKLGCVHDVVQLVMRTSDGLRNVTKQDEDDGSTRL